MTSLRTAVAFREERRPSFTREAQILASLNHPNMLYPLTAACVDTGALLINYSFELIQKTAGIAAACGGQWQEAEHHYQTALRQTEDIPHKIEQPEAPTY